MNDRLEFGELRFERTASDWPRLLGSPPPMIGVSEEFIHDADGRWVRVDGDDIRLTCEPENLHYRIVGRSVVHQGVLLAERVDD